MNNSLPRLIDGMVATLRKEIIPHIEGDFARGQAYGVMYMLNSLKLRSAWSNAFLGQQLRALADLSHEVGALAPLLPGAPIPSVQAPEALPDADALEAARDEGDAALCALIDWLAANGPRLAPEVREAPKPRSIGISTSSRATNWRRAPSQCSSRCLAARRRVEGRPSC